MSSPTLYPLIAMSAYDKESITPPPQSLPGSDPPPAYTDSNLTYDEEVLASLGYKPQFKREFSLWTCFCVSFAVLGLLPSFASTLFFGMGYAGTPAMVWGWLIAMGFIQCVAMSMAELCSAMPTSGGLYYAAAVLAPEGWGPLAACKISIRSTPDRAEALTISSRAHRLEQLVRAGHRSPFRRLRAGIHDPRCRPSRQPIIQPRSLPRLPLDCGDPHHPRHHQQHANKMDRNI